jgi:hypothetical protein
MNRSAIARAFDEADEVGAWSQPDMSILSAGRSAPPPFPDGLFGEAWPLVRDIAQGAGAPVDYVAATVLGVAASLIGGKRRVRPFDTANWEEPCILWFAVVGDPSSNKSPAVDSAVGPLRPIESRYAEDHRAVVMVNEATKERAAAERKAWQQRVKTAMEGNEETPPLPEAAVEPECPERRRLLVQDSTPEALASILSANPAGTLHLRDELAGWFQSFDRYSPGGREFWLEAYGGRVHTIDRKGSPIPIRVPFNGVSVVGGIQPEKLVDMFMSSPDDGLVARFLWAWPDPIPYHRPARCADINRLQSVYERLDGLAFEHGFDGERKHVCLPLTADAADVFEAWVAENAAAVLDAAALYKSFMGKARGTVLRLALVAELLSWAVGFGAEPLEVSAKSVVAAIAFFEEYAAPTALRVFGDAALPRVERNSATLGRYILRENLNAINARDVRRLSRIPSLRDAEPVDEAIQHLVEADWLRPVHSRSGPTPGRARKDYEVNPAVHGAARG